jgi:GGDEF domain-containing protein
MILRALNPLGIEWEASHYSIGASMGLAMNTADFADEKPWLEAADKACYIAKRQGRGRLAHVAPTPGDEALIEQG